MRLREMKYELEQLNRVLDMQVDIVNNEIVKVKGIHIVNSTINKINGFGFIDDEYEYLMVNYDNVLSMYLDEVHLKNETYENYSIIVNKIALKLNAVIDAISMAIDNQDENTISIKLPPFTDLKLVSNFIGDINKIFKGVLPDKKQSEIKLSTFDTGSNWIEVVLSCAESVVIIGEFIKITTELSKNILSIRNTTKQIESTLSIEDEARRVVLSSMKTLEEEQSRISASKMLESGVVNPEDLSNINEYQNGLSMQILTMAGYLIEGAEVKPALNAPEEQKVEFPSNEEYKLLQESANLLLLNSPLAEQETKEQTEEQE